MLSSRNAPHGPLFHCFCVLIHVRSTHAAMSELVRREWAAPDDRGAATAASSVFVTALFDLEPVDKTARRQRHAAGWYEQCLLELIGHLALPSGGRESANRIVLVASPAALVKVRKLLNKDRTARGKASLEALQGDKHVRIMSDWTSAFELPGYKDMCVAYRKHKSNPRLELAVDIAKASLNAGIEGVTATAIAIWLAKTALVAQAHARSADWANSIDCWSWVRLSCAPLTLTPLQMDCRHSEAALHPARTDIEFHLFERFVALDPHLSALPANLARIHSATGGQVIVFCLATGCVHRAPTILITQVVADSSQAPDRSLLHALRCGPSASRKVRRQGKASHFDV